MRRGRHAGDRDNAGQRRIRVDHAADDIEEVELAGRRQPARDLHALLLRQALVEILVGDHADADDEVRPHRLAHRVDDAEGEAQPVVERTVELIVATIGQRRPEAIHEMAVGFELDAVETGRLAALRRRRVVGDDAVDVPVLHRLREGAMGRLAYRRRRQDRQPVGLVPSRPASEMGDLDHHLAIMLVAGIGDLAQPRHDLVSIDMEIAECRRTVARDDRRAGGHGQRHAALGLFSMVEPVALFRHAIFRIGRLMARRHDPVLQGQVLEPVWTQQRIVSERRVHASVPSSVDRSLTRGVVCCLRMVVTVAIAVLVHRVGEICFALR